MELSIVILKQILLMFLYMMAGFFLYRKKLVTKQGSRELGNILLYVILPAVIIKAYMVPFSAELLRGLILSFTASLGALVLSMILSRAFFGGRRPVEEFCSAFSNAGFIGIPLVEMTFDDSSAVFYVSSFVALLNIFQWTYGVAVMTGKKDSITAKKLITNPVVLSFLAGILLFLLPLEVPELPAKAITATASMNAPMAMIILGIYLAQMRIRDLFTDRHVWLCSLTRLLVIPSAALIFLLLFPGDRMLKLSILIVSATPVGSNAAIFAQLNGLDYTQAVKDICLSTLLCIVTVPAVTAIWSVIVR